MEFVGMRAVLTGLVGAMVGTLDRGYTGLGWVLWIDLVYLGSCLDIYGWLFQDGINVDLYDC